MLISICIPTYHRPVQVREAIESALAQTYRPIEIVVGDDSKDARTETALADLMTSNQIRYVHNTPSLGQAGNVNRLFDLAQGELLVLLHDDDLLVPDAVARLARCFEESPGITAAYGKQYIVGEDGTVDEKRSEFLNATYRRTAPLAGRQASTLLAGITAQFPNDGYLLRSDVARRVRYRNEPEVGDACDFDFGLRLAAVADGFYFLDQYTAKYRVSSMSVSTGNNYTNLTYDLLARTQLPAELEPARHEQMQRYAVPAVSRWLALGDKKSARRVYSSAAYGWRRRLSSRGLVHALLLLVPAGLSRRAIGWARSVRKRSGRAGN